METRAAILREQPQAPWLQRGQDALGGCLWSVVRGCHCPGADGGSVQPSWLHLYIITWGGFMFIRVGLTAFLRLRVVYFFGKRNSRQTLSGEFANMRETKQIPRTNYLKFCTV